MRPLWQTTAPRPLHALNPVRILYSSMSTCPAWMGLECRRRLREHLACPIIFLTARVEDVDQLDGFAAGADDYVLKPFSLEVLGRRVAAHLARENRVREQGSSVKFFERLTIVTFAVEVRGDRGEAVPVELTRTEFDIIALLSKSLGRSV